MQPASIIVRLIVCTSMWLGWVAPVSAASDTLVKKAADNSFQPGLAKSWRFNSETEAVFVLLPEADGAAIAKVISERLAGVKVTLQGKELILSGIPKGALLEQVANLSMSGSADPLGELAGLGGTVVAMDTPEGGGSIRASKPAATTQRPYIIKDHDPNERLEAEVLEVKKGTFPSVVLRLKVRRTAKAGPLRTKVRYGKVLEAPVLYTSDKGMVDLVQPENQQNLSAWFLSPGDRVTVHATAAEGDKLEVDWIMRKAE